MPRSRTLPLPMKSAPVAGSMFLSRSALQTFLWSLFAVATVVVTSASFAGSLGAAVWTTNQPFFRPAICFVQGASPSQDVKGSWLGGVSETLWFPASRTLQKRLLSGSGAVALDRLVSGPT